MKTMKRFVAIFAMMVMAFTTFAGAATMAAYEGVMPFTEDNEYTGVDGSSASGTWLAFIDDWGNTNSVAVNYAVNDTGHIIYVAADGSGAVDSNLVDYSGNWEYIDVYSAPFLTPIIETLGVENGEIDYVWLDMDRNFWMSIAMGGDVLHIDNKRNVYDSTFNHLTLEEANSKLSNMAQASPDVFIYTPEMLQANLNANRDNIPDPNGGGIFMKIVVVVSIIAIGAGIVEFIRKKNRPVAAEGAPMDEQPINEKTGTEKAAEAAAKAANMANDAATKATDAAKTAAFMAKEKANEFSKAFKDAQARQKAAEKIICPNCGTANDVGSKFCANCGTKLGDQ